MHADGVRAAGRVTRGADLALPPALRRRFEAVIVDWDATAGSYHHTNAGVLRTLVERSCEAGLDLTVVASGRRVPDQLCAHPRGPGRLRFCVDAGREVLEADGHGLRLVHRAQPGTLPTAAFPRWVLADLWQRGVNASAVACVGTQPGAGPADDPPGRVVTVSGGPELLRVVLDDQLRRRQRAEIGRVEPAPGWGFAVDGDEPGLTRVHESLLTVADGRLGTRGTPVAGNGATMPAVLLAGAYEGEGAETELARLPLWSRFAAEPSRPTRRVIDLHAGVLYEDGPLPSLRFSSLARPGTVVLRVRDESIAAAPRGRRSLPGLVHATLVDRARGAVLERFGAYDPDPGVADAAATAAAAAGFDALLREHREAWARRWREADVVVEGDPQLQRAIRLALFHLMASVADRGEAAVGARGLTGPAYRGHVFWDSDVFVLPFLAATHPPAARAMLEYRARRLPAARAAARRLGRDGARFPWESAATGTDVTPGLARLTTGEVVRIHTGELEEHIVACVAWAAACYRDWTQDAAFAAGAGRDIIAETARYWASRIRTDASGRGHIDGVVGPDEYHPGVDDNAFTNVMARWNLRQAAALPAITAPERARWLRAASSLVDGYDPRTGIYEQFAGFVDLEPVVIAEVSPRRPIAADLLLGADRTARAQVIKQPDVLMLHHLVPDEVAPGSLPANLDFYEPRTAHGSSLSPAIHAALLARAGRVEPALAWLRVASRIDLDDLTGTTAGGVHLATMGGLWQALVFGFAGVRIRSGRLLVQPHLPRGWHAVELGLCLRGAPVRLRIAARSVEIDSDALALRRSAGRWEVTPR